MSVRKRKKREKEKKAAPMSAAGLMTFYEEEIGGVKVRPEIVILTTLALIGAVLLAHLGLFG
ncbi:MAG TPA: preprotein translocase subunit Sec61beta [Thermofilum sp.]|nr:preprotein translocase subunit Sec61beta [Thermofilum sp.]